MRAAASIVELRQLLAERFPQAHGTKLARDGTVPVATGVPGLDALLCGGLPKGELSELVGEGHGSGSAQVIHAFLRRVAADGRFLALVDGADSFDVDPVEPDVLSRLLWVRCTKADEALKAADILLRDPNFPFVILDLKLNPVAQLRKIPSSVWHRFRRLLEQNGATTLVVTPYLLVAGAACRVRVESKLGLGALAQPPSQVLGQLRFGLLRGESHEEDEVVQAG
jgi:RecA/RadA recombinase